MGKTDKRKTQAPLNPFHFCIAKAYYGYYNLIDMDTAKEATIRQSFSARISSDSSHDFVSSSKGRTNNLLKELRSFQNHGKTTQTLLFSGLGVAFFSLIANGFAYFNFSPQHDAINHSLGFAGAWEVSLGRFLLPVYGYIFGDITTPWLIGFLSILFLTGCSFLIADLFSIRSKPVVFLLSGLLAANMTVTEMNAIFIYVEASYLLSFLFCCFGIYILVKKPSPSRVFLSAILLTISLGLYQSYIACGLILLLFAVCKDILTEKFLIKNCLRKWVAYFCALLLGAIFYVIGFKLSLLLWQTAPADSGNSPIRILELHPNVLISRITHAYGLFFDFFYGNGSTLGFLFSIANILLTVAAGISLVLYLRQRKLPALNYILLLLLMAVYPLLSLLICILRGVTSIYFLTAYALFMLYPGLLLILTQWRSGKAAFFAKNRPFRVFVFTLLIIILWRNIVYSNGAYSTQKLLYDRTLSITTRILDTINETPGYLPRQTPIILVGSLNENSNLDSISAPYSVLSGFQKTSTTYSATFGSMAKILGDYLNFESDESILNFYQSSTVVQSMPIYPQSGYCQMLDGYLILKLS